MKWAGLIVAAVLVAGGVWWWLGRTAPTGQKVMPEARGVTPGAAKYTFTNPVKSAHYESNTPAHRAVLAGVPLNVVVDFNFDLASPSAISVTRGGQEYGAGKTVIATNKLALRRSLLTQAPDGLYSVNYTACWPDGSCHDGSFQFAIDRSGVSSYLDRRGQKQVMVDLKDIAFAPQNLRVSPGTTVNWTNSDSVGHYINTDSHPAHSYYPAQNSQLLNGGDRFSLTFDRSGIYPYHCSTHPNMTANILVE